MSSLLGNKTPGEVTPRPQPRPLPQLRRATLTCVFCRLQVFARFQDLMGLFRTAAGQSGSGEEAPPPGLAAAVDEERAGPR